MQSEILLKWLRFIGVVVVIAFSMIVIFLPDETKVALVQKIILSEPVGAGLPVRLTIPKINVDASVESLGLASDGTMAAPKDPADVGWYNLGPRPGEIGSAVIDGHFGWKNNTPAVFDNIDTLRKGDKIYMEDGNGTIITFVVREIRTYDPTAEASEVFDSSDEKAHLNLITCEGVWDAVSKSYSGRLVVFADKE